MTVLFFRLQCKQNIDGCTSVDATSIILETAVGRARVWVFAASCLGATTTQTAFC
jgi:hypothetical protein